MGLLLGQPRAQTVVAASDVVCYGLDKKGFDAIMQARPELPAVVDGLRTDELDALLVDRRDGRTVGGRRRRISQVPTHGEPGAQARAGALHGRGTALDLRARDG